MSVISGIDRIVIFLGDIILFYLSLVIALAIRYWSDITVDIVEVHLIPFTLLFCVWIVVFIVAGLYEKHVRLIRNRLPGTIFKIQVVNSVIAVLFFYAVPYFGIAPKTTLFVYLVVSCAAIFLWRVYGPILLGQRVQEAVLIGSGGELQELAHELTHNTGYPLLPVVVLDLNNTAQNLDNLINEALKRHPGANLFVADIRDSRIEQGLSHMYHLISYGYSYVEFHRLYEDVFKRVPVSLLDTRWIIQNISLLPRHTYDLFKRITDIVASMILMVFAIPLYILAYVMIKIDDGGPALFIHERVGQHGVPVRIIKFRSMPVHDERDGVAKVRTLTRVGAFLRKSRIDELPQLWNVFRGDISLIGPRPEIPVLVKVYEAQIPYYHLRHTVKPGLSGWAQIHQKTPPKFMAEVDATAQKVAYDFFYIKHRSVFLDVIIALQTIRELVSRRGI